MKRKTAIGIIFLTVCAFMLYWIDQLFFRKRKLSPVRNISDYKSMIDGISEIIIPKTDTPGAKEAGVSLYIITVIESCLSNRDMNTMLFGLRDMEEYCQNKYSLTFDSCPKEKKIAALEYFQNKGIYKNNFLNKVRNKLLGPSFFEIIKDLTVKGYCVSEVGATQGLAYQHVPVKFIACIPLLPNQRSWATA